MSFFGRLRIKERRKIRVLDAEKNYTQEIQENYQQIITLRLSLLEELSEQNKKKENKLELHQLNELRKELLHFSFELAVKSNILKGELFSTYIEEKFYLDQSPTIIFVHGHDQNSSTWHQYMFQLQELFDVVSYDRIGYGLSESNTPTFSFDEQIEQLQTVIAYAQAKKTNKKILFISNGFGSYLVEQLIQSEFVSHENICTSVMISYSGEFAKPWQENYAIRYKKKLLKQRSLSHTLSKAYKPDVLLLPLLKNIRNSDQEVLNPIESNYLLSELDYIISIRKSIKVKSLVPEIYIALENDFVTTPEQVNSYFKENLSEDSSFYTVAKTSDTSLQGHPSAILNAFFPAIHKYSSEIQNTQFIQQLSVKFEQLALVDIKYGRTSNLSGIISQLRTLEKPIDVFFSIISRVYRR
jgi:hypothetical protein